MAEPGFGAGLLAAMAGRKRRRGVHGQIRGALSKAYRDMRKEEPKRLRPGAYRTEQSNTSMLYGEELFLKLFRKLDRGVNPDLEIGKYLAKRGFEHTPPPVGEMEYRPDDGGTMTLALVQRLIPNEGDAWSYTLDALSTYFERLAAVGQEAAPVSLDTRSLLAAARSEPSEQATELMGAYLESARVMGLRTAELHATLASATSPELAPEPFSALYQRSLYQSMRNLVGRNFNALGRAVDRLSSTDRGQARDVLSLRPAILDRMRKLVGEKMSARRIRTHGDYHLGQVLYTGRDFVIIDFEGEPARPITERRLKRSPLGDVAGMLRSFDYAVHAALRDEEIRGLARAEDLNGVEGWAAVWTLHASAAFLGTYLDRAAGAGFLPEK
ncbi:MAG: phosphotransferase, partial [Gemmatimonadetes bacterium]|nr:phosphotransferase [Gemmatimonadota bacterium]NIQ53754.1 phosphotransferase [Gemmatimonadota bacterium]NIU73933.1 phosphotransferase [Gammaproteobacteria bacterium]NIX44406.1 phosphotransferase [Gemmatimonadota bacterium]NIY08625.1 phosphotransferase [Gemmatimonadota bacterium]